MIYPSYNSQDYRICVAGMILQYFPSKGLFKFDSALYNTLNTYEANVTKSFGKHYIATAEAINILKNLATNSLGEVL